MYESERFTAAIPVRLLAACILAIAAACGGGSTAEPSQPPPPPPPPPGPSAGTMQVSITTGGSDLDTDGYTISVSGGAAQPIGANATVTLAPGNGNHSVLLNGIAANCAVTGSNPRSAAVTGGSQTSVAFVVTCGAVVQSLTGRIAFETKRTGNYEIFVMNADGTNPVNLSNNPALDFEPDWSPDGKKIAFVSRRDGNDEIYVMNADGSGQTRLTFNGAEDTGPDWSPDGTKILFESERDGNPEVYVMNANGGGQANLSKYPGYDDHPAWSPNGQKIAFASDRIPSKSLEVFVMNADGTGVTDISNNNAWFDGRPAWSPDGSKIAFVSTRDTPAGAADDNYEIYVMNANGSNQMRLTNHAELDSYPVFSPHGQYIAFRSDRTGNIEIFTMKADGTSLVNRTNNAATDCHPTWTAGAFVSAPAAPAPPPALAAVVTTRRTETALRSFGGAACTDR
ncbi:MAG: hypothetical protein HOP28_12810 [Gemmatimonadales bacterium]|nr:hypothetical protein [Gemmatimonadales bacterium]